MIEILWSFEFMILKKVHELSGKFKFKSFDEMLLLIHQIKSSFNFKANI